MELIIMHIDESQTLKQTIEQLTKLTNILQQQIYFKRYRGKIAITTENADL